MAPGPSLKVSNPDLWSKTVFHHQLYEADGSFDHLVPPTPPQSSIYGASTVSIENEIVTAENPTGPIGLGTRVSLLAISPWSKGGYVNSQVFDHTSVIRFIEERFGVVENNISPWRRAVVGDLTSAFNFANPNDVSASLPSTAGYLPPTAELAGGNVNIFQPTHNSVTLGVPAQEQGIRTARALPYELHVHGTADTSGRTVSLRFSNSGRATAVFLVRSINPADTVRNYTVEPGKKLDDTWNVPSPYGLSVYGPNGFVRFFNGSVTSGAALLDVRSRYRIEGQGWDGRDWDGSSWDDPGTERSAAIGLKITNLATHNASLKVIAIRAKTSRGF